MRQDSVRPVALAILDLILSVVFAILLWAFKPTTKTERDNMNILEIFAQLQALVSELQAKIEEQSASIEAEKQASYDEGFAAGAASVGSDKIYSQAELDAAIAQAKAELEAQNGDLMVQLDGVKAQVLSLESQFAELQASVETKVSEAVAAFKADLLAKYEAAQAAESEIEASIADLLK